MRGLLTPAIQLKDLSDQLRSLTRGRLWAQILVGLVFGVLVGILLGPSIDWVDRGLAKTLGDWLALPGQVFLALIKMIIVPLIFASIIAGISQSESLETLKRIGLASMIFFSVTTLIAIFIGVGLALLVQPGKWVDGASLAAVSLDVDKSQFALTQDSIDFPSRIVNLIPANPLDSILQLEMLQVVVFAIILGVAMVAMSKSESEPLIRLLGSLQQVCITVVRGAMKLAPIAVFGLTAQLSSQVGLGTLAGMSVYMLTVLLGLFILGGLYLLIVQLFGRVSVAKFLQSSRELQLLAFSTSSSAAVMPMSLKVAEEKLNVKPAIAQLVIPLGATMNMNGTALYQAVASLFLIQAFGIEIELGAIILIIVTSVTSSIGSSAPGVGIVILSMILSSVGVPAAGVALILGVDRLLDMSRTAINVTGDLVATLIIDRRLGID